MLEAIGLYKRRWASGPSFAPTLTTDPHAPVLVSAEPTWPAAGSADAPSGGHLAAEHGPGNPRWLVSDLHLTVLPGETVALLGASGSGKSTLLKMLAGLESMDGGKVRWAGQNLTHTPPDQRGFALMFQDFALFPHLNVQDNVAFGPVERGLPRAQARAQAVALLASFGLADRALSRVTQLSGGEQQRVALARALASQPRALLLDEPFSALDADLRQRLRGEFAQRIADAGMACVLVTHDAAEARTMGQRGYRLHEGRLEPLWAWS